MDKLKSLRVVLADRMALRRKRRVADVGGEGPMQPREYAEEIIPAGQLPIASSPEFAESIRHLADIGDCELPAMQQVLDNRAAPLDQRFSALYAILFRLERTNDFVEYDKLCDNYRVMFSREPYFDTFAATSMRVRGGSSNLRTALTLSERAVDQLSDRPGVLHQFAIIAADLLDLEPDANTELADRALARVDTAIRISLRDNPNFHVTRARLLARIGDFTTADREITLALGLEDTSSPDSLRRIARFEATRSSIRALKNEIEFKKIVEESKGQLSSLRAEQLQLLGILAAVVALIMVTVATGGRIDSAVGASRFTAITFGSILIVFSGLFYMTQGVKNVWRIIIPLLLAVGLFALGIWGGEIL